jgi:hypothetical protein
MKRPVPLFHSLVILALIIAGWSASAHAQPAGTISINSGAAYTGTTAVTLNLTSTDPSGWVRFSNDNIRWTGLQTFATSIAWTLPSGDGTKTVYAQFRDTAGNYSSVVSDSIILDTTAPTGTIAINGGAAYTGTTAVTLNLTATDNSNMVGGWMRFSNDNVNWTFWAAYSPTVAWSLASANGTKTVYAQFSDAAGNFSSVVSDSIILDTTPPTGTIAINGGAAYTGTTAVTLNLTATDNASGVNKVLLSNDGVNYTEQAYVDTVAWILSSGDGTKTVYARFKDAVGNLSGEVSDTIVLDSPPTGTITINGGAAYTNTTAVTLSLTATNAVKVLLSNDGWNYTESAYADTKAWVLSSGDGTKTVYAKFKSASGNVSSDVSDTIILDSTLPTGTITINGGAAYTNTTAVTLSLTATNAVKVLLSNDGWNYTESAYADTKAWVLSSNDGTKTVYAKFKNAVGNYSSVVSDSIILDTTAPTGTIAINGGAAYTGSTSVTLNLSATDTGSGVTNMWLGNDGDYYQGPYTYSTTYNWTLPAGDGPKKVWAKFADAAGNQSFQYSATITLDTLPPASCFILIEGGKAYTNSTGVTLTLGASDASPILMRFSNDNIRWTGWQNYTTNMAWALPSGDGTKTVYAEFKDIAENVAPTVNAAILLDTIPPTNGALTATPGTSQVNLSWSGFSDTNSGIEKYLLLYSTSGYPGIGIGTLIYQGTSTSFPHTTLGPGNNHYYRVYAVDRAGNNCTGATAYVNLKGKAVIPPLQLLLE